MYNVCITCCFTQTTFLLPCTHLNLNTKVQNMSWMYFRLSLASYVFLLTSFRLKFVFGPCALQALDLVDQRSVTCLSSPSGRKAYQVCHASVNSVPLQAVVLHTLYILQINGLHSNMKSLPQYLHTSTVCRSILIPLKLLDVILVAC